MSPGIILAVVAWCHGLLECTAHPCISDLQMLDHGTIRFFIKRRKTNQFRKERSLDFHFKFQLLISRQMPSPVFTIQSALHQRLRCPSHSTHSFRIGAAQQHKQQSIKEQIKVIGHSNLPSVLICQISNSPTKH